jgi:DNA polymerase I
MQIVDISSLSHANQSFEDIIRAAYIVQETRRTTDTLFFIDETKISSEVKDNIEAALTQRGIKPFITNKPLYHYLDSLQESSAQNIELQSQDYLAISRASDNTYLWDISNMKRYSTKEFSNTLLEFPHNRLGLFALLTQDNYHNIVTNVNFEPSSAISLVQSYDSLRSLIRSDSVPANLQKEIGELSKVARVIAPSLKINKEIIDPSDYFSHISLSKDEMRSIKGKSVESTDEQKNFYKLTDQLKIAKLIKKIDDADIKKIIINIDDDYVALRVGEINYIAESSDGLSSEEIYNTFAPLLENDNISKVAFSAKSSHKIGLSKGISIISLRDDIELAEFTLNNLSKQQTLEDLMTQYFFEPEKPIRGMEKVADELESVERLHDKLNVLLKEDESYKHYSKIEMPMAKVLANMEYDGVFVNSGKLLQLSQYITELLSKENSAIRQFSPHTVNINAPKDVAKLLFDTLQLPTKNRSTSEDNLNKLEASTGHPIINHILNSRKLSKLNSTFAMKLPQKIDPTTNRVHCTYNQNKAKTGRLSCQDPNLQAIPSTTKLGRAIRKAFEALKGRKIIAADYSQVELKILAHLAQDEMLIEAFKSGRDIHQSTAGIVFNKNYDDVTGDERKAAKAINFGLIYGMTKYGLASKLGVNTNKAESFINTYFEKLPQTAKFIQGIKDSAQKLGYIKTITGRKIHITNIHSNDHKLKESALRAASNAPMQGSASDIIKLAMVKTVHELKVRQLDAKLVMQVHDEIIIDCEESVHLEVAKILKNCMENAVKLSVGLDVEVGVGENWENAHPIEIKHEVEDLGLTA